MSTKKTAVGGGQVGPADGTDQTEAERIAAEQAARVEAERIAAEQAAVASGVLQRRECIEGVWYAHGVLLTAQAVLCEALRGDGALDMHASAIEYALSTGAPQITHVSPPAADL